MNHTGTGASFWVAIKVDGKLLVDSGVSVANVPSIASTVRANPSAGFSIVTWTGTSSTDQKIGHGLNAAPEIYILRPIDTAFHWHVYTTLIDGSLDYLNLDKSDAKQNASVTSLPTSSVFTNRFGTGNYLAYCFAPISGYSAMGSYTGNGSADGPFVFTGFKPAWLMFKETTGGSDHNWFIFDSKRNTFNVLNEYLEANLAATANTHSTVDFLSNGFKFRTSNNLLGNGSGDTYIYLAFAENPFKNARAR